MPPRDNEQAEQATAAPSAPKRTRRVAIVGTSATSVVAPFDDPSWEIWSMTDRSIKRWDRFFELHDREVLDRDKVYEGLIANDGTRIIYTRKEFVGVIPGAVEFPFDALTAKYSSWFMSSTVAWAMALAIEEGDVAELGLFGIDMAAGTEYASQKPGCRYFIQIARLSGIAIKVPTVCELLTPTPRYGIDAEPILSLKVRSRKAELEARLAALRAEMFNLGIEVQMLRGKLEVTISDDECRARLATVKKQYEEWEQQGYRLEGAIQDMEHVSNNWLG